MFHKENKIKNKLKDIILSNRDFIFSIDIHKRAINLDHNANPVLIGLRIVGESNALNQYITAHSHMEMAFNF